MQVYAYVNTDIKTTLEYLCWNTVMHHDLTLFLMLSVNHIFMLNSCPVYKQEPTFQINEQSRCKELRQ